MFCSWFLCVRDKAVLERVSVISGFLKVGMSALCELRSDGRFLLYLVPSITSVFVLKSRSVINKSAGLMNKNKIYFV